MAEAISSGASSSKRLIQQRRILVEPLLDEEQIDNIGIDLRLDFAFLGIRKNNRWRPDAHHRLHTAQ